MISPEVKAGLKAKARKLSIHQIKVSVKKAWQRHRKKAEDCQSVGDWLRRGDEIAGRKHGTHKKLLMALVAEDLLCYLLDRYLPLPLTDEVMRDIRKEVKKIAREMVGDFSREKMVDVLRSYHDTFAGFDRSQKKENKESEVDR